MSNFGKRIGALEAKENVAPAIWRRVVQEAGQTLDDALDRYGRDRIGAADNVIVRRIYAGAAR